jgi:DNA-binding transcriptional LysR family regulator
VHRVELRHLRYFLAVAEERNVTRAADKLGIGQPPLSQQLHALERELGVQLFRRTGHGVALTEAGAALAEDARRLLGDVQGAVRNAQRAGRGEVGHLNIGFTGSAAFNPMVPRLIRLFRQAFPNVQLTLAEGNTAYLLSLLDEGRLDVAFVRPGGSPPTGIEFHPLAIEPMKLVLPATHALSRKRKLRLTALAAEPFVLIPREASPSLYDRIVGACREAGFEPLLGQQAPQLASVINFVAAEFGVSMVPAAVTQIQVEGVVYIDVDGHVPDIGLKVAWRTNVPNAKVANFLQLARESGHV